MNDEPRLRLIRDEHDPPFPPGPVEGEVFVYTERGSVVILLRGDVDLGVSEDLEQAGRAAIDEGLPITADVRHVDVIDSVGLSFLIRLAASVRSAGGTLTLCGPAPRVEELLEVAGAADLFTWVTGRPGPYGQPTP